MGKVKVFTRIPALSTMSGPDTRYNHTILKGMILTNDSGTKYTTTQDITFNLDDRNFVVTEFSEDGSRITYYVYQAFANVASGENRTITVPIGKHQKFLKVEIKDTGKATNGTTSALIFPKKRYIMIVTNTKPTNKVLYKARE